MFADVKLLSLSKFTVLNILKLYLKMLLTVAKVTTHLNLCTHTQAKYLPNKLNFGKLRLTPSCQGQDI